MKIGVLFDVDGVLVDSYRPHLESWKDAAQADGQLFTNEQFQPAFGRTSREIVEMLWDAPRTPEQIKQIDEAKEEAYRNIVRRDFPAMDGAAKLVERLSKNGFLVGIGSSGPRPNVELAIEKLNIAPFLKTVFTGCDIKKGKPDPEVYLKGADAMQIPAENCVVVEDSRPGIAAAKAAGMKCIALLSYGHYIEEYEQADCVVYSLNEITDQMICDLCKNVRNVP